MKASERQVAGDHYKTMGVQPWDVVDTWPHEQKVGAYRAGALKYLMRMGSKDESPQEIAKGIHYMEKLLEVLKESNHAIVTGLQAGLQEGMGDSQEARRGRRQQPAAPRKTSAGKGRASQTRRR